MPRIFTLGISLSGLLFVACHSPFNPFRTQSAPALDADLRFRKADSGLTLGVKLLKYNANSSSEYEKLNVYAFALSKGINSRAYNVSLAEWVDGTRAKTRIKTPKFKLTLKGSDATLGLSLDGGKTVNLGRGSVNDPAKPYEPFALQPLEPNGKFPFQLAWVDAGPLAGAPKELVLLLEDAQIPLSTEPSTLCLGSEACDEISFAQACPTLKISDPACIAPKLKEQTQPQQGFQVTKLKRLSPDLYLWNEDSLSLSETIEVLFIDAETKPGSGNNQSSCEQKALILTASAFDQRYNQACQIKLAPSPDSASGQLSCRYEFTFRPPQSFREHGCTLRFAVHGRLDNYQEINLLFQPKLGPS